MGAQGGGFGYFCNLNEEQLELQDDGSMQSPGQLRTHPGIPCRVLLYIMPVPCMNGAHKTRLRCSFVARIPPLAHAISLSDPAVSIYRYKA